MIQATTTGAIHIDRGKHALAASLRLFAPALLAFAAVRLVCLVVLAIVAARRDVQFWPLLHSRFDSLWYASIALNGYDTEAQPHWPDGQPRQSSLAFFPLFPGLLRVTSAVLPVSLAEAGLVVSWVAGLAAAWGIFAVGNHVHGRECGVLLAAMWGALPHGLVLSMAYTETLFTALAAWALYALLTRRWIAAGSLCLLAGLSRPTAIVLIGTIVVAAAVAVWRREDRWRPWLALGLAPLGWLGYLGWVGHRLGRLDGWLHVQALWGMRFDGGLFTLRTAATFLVGEGASALTVYAVAFLIVMAAIPLAWALLRRQPLILLVYSAGMLALTLGGAGYFHAKARLLLPAFTLLLPFAAALVRSRRRLAMSLSVVTLMTAVSAAFGVYLTFVWPYSP